MLKLVIFDFDGTLCDSIPLCIRAFRAAIEPLAGRAVSDQEIIATFGPSEEGTIQALIPAYLEEGTAAYLRCYEAFHEDCRVFPGMRELLANLREKGLKTALVTGKGAKSCVISLQKLGLSPLLDGVETGSPEGPCKPAGMKRLLAQFEVRPEEAVYIGDAVSDIQASREAGIGVISAAWCASAEWAELEAAHPDGLCRNVGELRTLLEKLSGVQGDGR